MAEASSPSCRFFCHRCSTEISPLLPEFTCPHCELGFIEALPDEMRSGDSSPFASSRSGPTRASFELNVDHHQHLPTFPSGYSPFTLGIFNENFELRTWLPTEDNNRETDIRQEPEMASRQRYSPQPAQHGPHQEGVPSLEGILQQLVTAMSNIGIAPTPMPNIGIAPTGMPNIGIASTAMPNIGIASTAMPNIGMAPWGMLHSNPMDYAWGANGLDAIVTQLLNQFENTGPPPADGERIKRLPTISVTEEHVGAGLECPVCKEDYSAGEHVRQLPCNHLFHNDCIVPWLEQHDTCPVCRKSLNGQNTATNPPGISGMNFSSSPGNENASSNS
ncbi:E3 ubiquitin-protein ligase RNF126-like [Nerophis ophidion]|uniref:E3 ubiquitin-protein ligase RNF126-like n=1 Tax=Nerophis ophidion TaxID=159077 RepID=UPI002AE003E1|nr:E3 ubiquitin-protein ligase RNF126-like [Nerophis ophidion]